MEKYLRENFDVEPKRASEEARRRWRSAVSVVKNPRRRFRMVADLAKRSETERKRQKIQRREKYFYLFSCETECGHHLHSVLLVKTGIPMCMCVGFVDLKWFTQQVLKIKACGLPLPIHIVVATLIARLLTWVAT
uniref:Calcium-transporting P-type ATPase N-terminal autoinhibitory domain-containing protein n=1 Tax=Vitis vinifera TaxID=29760 RepID=A5AY00_VITVI|nr:hypothetical protein VITISV_038928 [Vitis vinifera]